MGRGLSKGELFSVGDAELLCPELRQLRMLFARSSASFEPRTQESEDRDNVQARGTTSMPPSLLSARSSNAQARTPSQFFPHSSRRRDGESSLFYGLRWGEQSARGGN